MIKAQFSIGHLLSLLFLCQYFTYIYLKYDNEEGEEKKKGGGAKSKGIK